MRIVDLKEAGSPENLQLGQAERPTPAADEVLIQVAYAGVNRPDVFQRKGAYPPPPGASPILGLEVSGIVAEVGSDVTDWQKGDRVCALTNGGGYAEFVAVNTGHCLPVPESLSLQQAAALPETCFTVWSNVFDRCRLQAGETLLVHAGASGIGSTAIQMAKAMGAKVLTTASTDAKCTACTELGADLAINYSSDDFVAAVKEATSGRGADVILDMVGGDYIQRNMSAAAVGGRIASIAFLRGSKTEVNMMPVMLKQLTLTGSTLRPQSVAAKAEIGQQLKTHIWPALSNGGIKPLLHPVDFELAQADEAHRLMEANAVIGKLLLAVNPNLEQV